MDSIAPRYRLEECHDDTVWDNFVDASPQGNIFCRSGFLKGLGVEYRRYFVAEGAARMLAFMVMLQNGCAVSAPMPFTMYQGIMSSPNLAEEPWHRRSLSEQKLLEFVFEEMANKYGRISFCMHPTWTDIRPFNWYNYGMEAGCRFSLDVRYTGWLALCPELTVAEFARTARTLRQREIRRAIRSGCKTEISQDVDMLCLLHELTFARQGILIDDNDKHLVRSISAAALREKLGEIRVGIVDGKIASAYLILYDNVSGYYLFGANDPEFRDSGASSLLMADCIHRCAGRGLQRFDFVGINSPRRGDFKQSFGAHPVPYYVANWSASSKE